MDSYTLAKCYSRGRHAFFFPFSRRPYTHAQWGGTVTYMYKGISPCLHRALEKSRGMTEGELGQQEQSKRKTQSDPEGRVGCCLIIC
ncbi:unnamed protein product [Urochloa humidicola]